jgi:hypothetical protein
MVGTHEQHNDTNRMDGASPRARSEIRQRRHLLDQRRGEKRERGEKEVLGSRGRGGGVVDRGRGLESRI